MKALRLSRLYPRKIHIFSYFFYCAINWYYLYGNIDSFQLDPCQCTLPMMRAEVVIRARLLCPLSIVFGSFFIPHIIIRATAKKEKKKLGKRRQYSGFRQRAYRFQRISTNSRSVCSRTASTCVFGTVLV